VWEEECVVDSFDGVAICCTEKKFCIEQKIMPVLNKLLLVILKKKKKKKIGLMCEKMFFEVL
jgi:hypothetical protein